MKKLVLQCFTAGAVALALLTPAWADDAVAGVSSTSSSAASPSAASSVTVVRGDTLTAIAARHGVSLESLIAANPQIRDPDRIWPGDRVKIPAGRTLAAKSLATTPLATAKVPALAGDGSANDAACALVGTRNASDKDGSWGGWCLRLVNVAFAKAGRPLKELQTSCAKEAFLAFEREGIVEKSGAPPRGAIVFWSWVGTVDGVTKDWGHVALSNGDGTVISTLLSGGIDPGAPLARFGTPLGWVLPPASK